MTSIREVLGHRHDSVLRFRRGWAADVAEHRAADPETDGLRPVRVKVTSGGYLTIWDDAPTDPPNDILPIG